MAGFFDCVAERRGVYGLLGGDADDSAGQVDIDVSDATDGAQAVGQIANVCASAVGRVPVNVERWFDHDHSNPAVSSCRFWKCFGAMGRPPPGMSMERLGSWGGRRQQRASTLHCAQ